MTGLVNKIGKVIVAPIFSVAALLQGAMPSQAADVVTLKLGHTLPATHYIAEQLVKKFAAGIEEASGGEIKFELFPAAQLGRDTPGLLGSGLLDVGVVITGLQAGKFPLTAVAELPEASRSSCEGTAKTWALAQPGGLLDQLEYKPQGIRALSAHVLAPYMLFTLNKKIEKVADTKGLKIYVNGPAGQKAVSELASAPILIPSTEVYDSATRGTIDGAIFPYSGLTQYSLQNVLKYATNGVNFGSGAFFIGMSEKRWSALSEKHRTVISEEMMKAQKSFCEWIDNSDVELRKKVAATEGYTVVELDEASRKEFVDVFDKVATSWAAQIDSTGRQGTAVLKAFRDAE